MSIHGSRTVVQEELNRSVAVDLGRWETVSLINKASCDKVEIEVMAMPGVVSNSHKGI